MLIKIVGVVAILLAVFMGYVASRPSFFRYERSAIIKAPAEKIYPHISNFKLGSEWSPYEKMDLSMKKTYTGQDGQVGSKMEFEGNKEVGTGQLEMLKIVPNEVVEIKLTMLKPFRAENNVVYKLSPESGGTRFTWTMSGENGFLGKLVGAIIDCDKMIGGQFDVGIANLKTVVEAK